MGVPGLLPTLREITRSVSLEKYRGASVAIDCMNWLHRGIITGDVRSMSIAQFEEKINKERSNENCYEESKDLIQPIEKYGYEDSMIGKRIDFERYVQSHKNRTEYIEDKMELGEICPCVKYAIQCAKNLIKNFDMKLVLVVDGRPLPAKCEVDKERRREREKAFKLAQEAELKGDKKLARKLYTRACSITQEIRHEMIICCQREGIPFIVAPYESDAQLVRLAVTGEVDLVITEDSDLLVYGCPKVLLKLNMHSYKGEEIKFLSLFEDKKSTFYDWTHDMFIYMCILSGCDYCKGVPGIGIKKAYRLVSINRNPTNIFERLKQDKIFPKYFDEEFWTAYKIFRYQYVYCQKSKRLETLFPTDLSGDDHKNWHCIGSWIDPNTTAKIAEGIIHPITKTQWTCVRRSIQSEPENTNNKRQTSHSSPNYELQGKVQNTINTSKQMLSKKEKKKPTKNLYSFFHDGKDQCFDQTYNGELLNPVLKENLNKTNKGEKVAVNTRKEVTTNKRVPIRFKDYCSNLVGSDFETIISRRKKRQFNDSTNISLAIQRIKARSSLLRVKNMEINIPKKIDSSEMNHLSKKMRLQTNNGIILNKEINHLNVDTHGRDCEISHMYDDFDKHDLPTRSSFSEDTLSLGKDGTTNHDITLNESDVLLPGRYPPMHRATDTNGGIHDVIDDTQGDEYHTSLLFDDYAKHELSTRLSFPEDTLILGKDDTTNNGEEMNKSDVFSPEKYPPIHCITDPNTAINDVIFDAHGRDCEISHMYDDFDKHDLPTRSSFSEDTLSLGKDGTTNHDITLNESDVLLPGRYPPMHRATDTNGEIHDVIDDTQGDEYHTSLLFDDYAKHKLPSHSPFSKDGVRFIDDFTRNNLQDVSQKDIPHIEYNQALVEQQQFMLEKSNKFLNRFGINDQPYLPMKKKSDCPLNTLSIPHPYFGNINMTNNSSTNGETMHHTNHTSSQDLAPDSFTSNTNFYNSSSDSSPNILGGQSSNIIRGDDCVISTRFPSFTETHKSQPELIFDLKRDNSFNMPFDIKTKTILPLFDYQEDNLFYKINNISNLPKQRNNDCINIHDTAQSEVFINEVEKNVGHFTPGNNLMLAINSFLSL